MKTFNEFNTYIKKSLSEAYDYFPSDVKGIKKTY